MTSPGSTSSSATPLRLIQMVRLRRLAGADVAQGQVDVALERDDPAGDGDPLPELVARSSRPRSTAALGGRVVGMREREHHRHRLVAGVDDRVPDAGRDVQGRTGGVGHDVVLEPQLARAA